MKNPCSHPYVATPEGPCSTCGRNRSHSIHNWRQEKTTGTDHTGKWTPSCYANDCGWSYEEIEATAKLGIAEADEEVLTEEQQQELLEYCKFRVEQAGA